MDREYLKHIDSSPYVDEGFFDTAKATTAGLGQRAKNLLPSEDPYETPLNAKLQSYYKTLVNELKGILEEFSFGPKSPAERLKRSQLSQEQKELIDSLTNLYQVLVPSVFPAGTRPEIRGTTVQRTVRPPNVSYAQSMQHLAKEAWLGRASTRSGGEVDSIINKYLNDVKAAYSRFINNVKKHFPGVLASKVSDSFKTTLGNPRISKTLDKIESVVKAKAPEETPPTPSPAPAAPAASTTPRPRRASSVDEKKNANDFATLIAATLNIISQRVIEDKDSRPYYSKPLADGNFYLPKTVDEPYPLRHSSEWNPPHPPHEPENLASLPDTDPKKIAYLKDKEEYEKKLAAYRYVPLRNEKGEVVGYTYKLVTPDTLQSVPSPIPHAPQSPEPVVEADDSLDKDADNADVPDSTDDEDPTGEFLYDFASLFRKHRGSRDSYSIEVTRNPVKVVFGDGREMIIRVFWNWSNQINTILVQTLKDGKSWETSELLKFYDDEVNPQSPYYDSNFNIAHFLEQVEPNAKALFLKADKEKWTEVENAIKVFKPAAYAVIRRKGVMEFKSHKRLRFYIDTAWENSKEGDPHWGSVKLLRGKFGKYPRNSEIPFEEIHKYFYTKKNEQTQETFENALTQAGYWDDYVGIKEKFKEPAPIATSDEEERSTDVSRIPAASDAIKTLVVLGHKEKEAKDWIQQIVDKVGPDKTAEEYVKLAQKNPMLAPTPPVTPSAPTPSVVSKPSTPPADPSGSAPTAPSDPKVRSDDIKKIPAAIAAVAELKKMKLSFAEAWELVGKAIETLGPDKTKEEYIQFASKEYKALPPAETAPEAPKTPAEPVSTPSKAKKTSEILNMTFDDNTGVVQYFKDENPITRTPKQLNSIFKQKQGHNLLPLLKAINYPFEKFGVNVDVKENFINPFQWSNFI